jgi:SOS-response transcriptional repressor LexA
LSAAVPARDRIHGEKDGDCGKMRKIPVISWVAVWWSTSPLSSKFDIPHQFRRGKWTETGEMFLEEDVIEWIETDAKGEHNFALQVKGDSMEPEFKEGETLVINPTAKAENGDYIIVKNDEEEATFNQFKRYDNMKILHPLDPQYNNIVMNKDKEYRIAGW